MTRIAVLGGGPAGVGAAYALARRGLDVTLVEQRETVGGNSGSFELEGLRADYGSHRLHPASDPEVLALIRERLGAELLTRPRHGRIRLLGRWIHFPLRAGDLALRTPPRFGAGVALDLAAKLVPSAAQAGEESFASVLRRGLGRTICEEFYFPYARKVWGLAPEEMSPIQARRRVSSGSIGKMLKRLLPGAGSGGASTKGVFYYPRGGFGQISEALAAGALERGARLMLGTSVTKLRLGASQHQVELEGPDGKCGIGADYVWSTLPIPLLARACEPAAPAEVITAARALRFRAMLLVYLVLDADRFSEYDAHYFPGAELRITRLSEPKNYAALAEPRGTTLLCAELPCQTDDAVWSMGEAELGALVQEDLARSGIPVRANVRRVAVRRLSHAYPLYPIGYERHFAALDAWAEQLPRVLSFGRQGLFAHDNTHHALYMALCASKCLRDDGSWNEAQWREHRRVFETHVVED
ncbi:MAG TPA: FAD-dependent oxidoreductase [Myxococcota bacterium]